MFFDIDTVLADLQDHCVWRFNVLIVCPSISIAIVHACYYNVVKVVVKEK